MDIFVPIRFRTSIQLTPSDLIADFEKVILTRVKSSLEGVCSRYGYIRPDSIVILKRSAGSFIKQHFNGHIKFDMICKAEVCNPAVGAVFQATVKNKNALGVHAESDVVISGTPYPVLDIIIPKRSAGITSTLNLEELNIGDVINVEVLGKRYQLHDKKISIIGRAVRDVPSTAAPTNAPEGVEGDDDDEAVVDIDLLEEDDAEQEEEHDDDKSSNHEDDEDDGYSHNGGNEEEDVIEEEFEVSEAGGSDEEDVSDDYGNDDEY